MSVTIDNNITTTSESARALDSAIELVGHLDAVTAAPRAREIVEVTCRALVESRLDVESDKVLELLQSAGILLYRAGQVDFGIRLGERVLVYLKASGQNHPPMRLWALNFTGICSADSGDLSRAMEVYADALVLMDEEFEPHTNEYQFKVWQNLGVALAYSGMFSEANGCYDKAMHVLDGWTNQDVAEKRNRAAYHNLTNMAQSYYNMGETSLGLSCMRRAEQLTGFGLDPLDFVLAAVTKTRLLIADDRMAEARKTAAQARVFANKAGTGRADVNASLAEGIAEVFSGAHDVGLSRLTASLEKALFLNVTTREMLTALAKCYERAGRHEDALIYLKRLVSFQRDIHHGNILRHVKSRLDQIHALPVEGADPTLEVLSATELVAETATQRVMRREVFLQSIQGLVRLAASTELREDKSGEHPYRVGKLAEILAKAAGCDEETIFLIGHSARLHDIGKVSLPDGISHKTVALNRNERTVMQAHAEAGSALLLNTKIKQIGMAAGIARWHHERWDGQGYPDQRQGSDIPLEARIASIAECFDAMIHERPYRAALSIDSALASIVADAGRKFDPELVPLFDCEIRRMVDSGVDLDEVLGAEARTTSFSLAKERVWASLRRPDGADGAPA